MNGWHKLKKRIHKLSDSDKLIILLTHIGGILLSFIPALVVYLTAEPPIKEQVRSAVNWQLTLLIYWAISVPLMLVLIGFVFFWILPTLNTIFSIIAAIKSSQGESFTYPLSINFIKT